MLIPGSVSGSRQSPRPRRSQETPGSPIHQRGRHACSGPPAPGAQQGAPLRLCGAGPPPWGALGGSEAAVLELRWGRMGMGL